MRIAVIGSGYVGLVSAACFAEIGHQVVSVDADIGKVAALSRGDVPIHEEWLPQLVRRHLGSRLRFSTTLEDAVSESEAVFITVGTPQSESGDADLSCVDAVVARVASSIREPKLIVEKSTVPVCTCDAIRKALKLNGASAASFSVASNPEFLREGTAVRDFLFPDRIVLGVDDEFSRLMLLNIYRPLADGSYYQRTGAILNALGSHMPELIVTDVKSSELIKHASNAFLALKISFINMIANIAESVGANIDQVSAGVGADPRIGSRFLQAGIGYGGSCFPKDVAALHAVASQCGVDASLLTEVSRINHRQQLRFLQTIRSALWTLRGKRIGILGLAFKGGTDDIRESPAIAIVQELLKQGARLRAYDPAAMTNAQAFLPDSEMEYAHNPYQAAIGCDALLILSDWNEFAHLDLKRLRAAMRLPIIVDGRNLYSPSVMSGAGFWYHSVGRPTPASVSLTLAHPRAAYSETKTTQRTALDSRVSIAMLKPVPGII